MPPHPSLLSGRPRRRPSPCPISPAPTSSYVLLSSNHSKVRAVASSSESGRDGRRNGAMWRRKLAKIWCFLLVQSLRDKISHCTLRIDPARQGDDSIG